VGAGVEGDDGVEGDEGDDGVEGADGVEGDDGVEGGTDEGSDEEGVVETGLSRGLAVQPMITNPLVARRNQKNTFITANKTFSGGR
jgi:hypothetical protein